MDIEHNSVERRGVDRRTVLAAAAWSAPVVAMAVATPLAAASVAGFDLFTGGLQQGDSVEFFNADATLKYTNGFTRGFTLMNHGPGAAPAGTLVRMRYDNRIVTPTNFTYRVGPTGTSTPLSYSTPIVNGNESIVEFVIPVAVPVGEDVYGPGTIWVVTGYDVDIDYPNDALDDYKVMYWQIVAADDDGLNNLHGSLTPTTAPANNPWGLEAVASFTSFTTDRCSMELPTSATVTSVGPGATPGNVALHLSLEPNVVTSVVLDALTIDGVPSSASIVSAGGSHTIDLGQPLAAGSVVQAQFSYTVDPAAPFVNNGFAQFSTRADDTGSTQDRRLTTTFVNGNNAACVL